jgi:phosphatidylserine synthase
MPQPRTTRIRARLNTYTGYSIGCAAVWAVILVVAQQRLDAQTRNTLRLACSGWWSGWTSATIARVSFPPPKKLQPRTEKRLGIVSIVLIAAGLISVIRLLITGTRSAESAAVASGR